MAIIQQLYVDGEKLNPKTSIDAVENLKNILDNTVSKEDLLRNVSYSDLTELKKNNKLVEGVKYQINDYITTTALNNTVSTRIPFNIIVEAISVSELSENAKAAPVLGVTYFSYSDLSAWELKYCIDNDTNRFTWADETNGKGVIYFMRDEFGNECHYDFKNIQFYRDADADFGITAGYYYTFSKNDANNPGAFIDGSLKRDSTNGVATDNVIDKDTLNDNITKKHTLNDTVFICGTGNSTNPKSNKFDTNCAGNTIGSACYSNNFGPACSGNKISSMFQGNSIGAQFQDNTIKSAFVNNIVGPYVGNITTNYTIAYCSIFPNTRTWVANSEIWNSVIGFPDATTLRSGLMSPVDKANLDNAVNLTSSQTITGKKTFNADISIKGKTTIAQNIDSGELKVLHNNSNKGFIVRTRNTSDSILPLELLSTNGTSSYTYSFPSLNGTLLITSDLSSLTERINILESKKYLTEVDEFLLNTVYNQLEVLSTEDPDVDDRASGYGYVGTLEKLGVQGEKVLIKSITIWTKDANIVNTNKPVWCRLLKKENDSWVKIAQSKNARSWDEVGTNLPLEFNLIPIKEQPVLTPQDNIAFVWVDDENASASVSYGLLGFRTTSKIGGFISNSITSNSNNTGGNSGFSPAIKLKYLST